MSGKGQSQSSSTQQSSSSNTASSQYSEPEVVSGWEYSMYAQNSDRYAYIGKDDATGEPEYIDYGPKGNR